MSTFKNISGEDRGVLVDGIRLHVPAGDTFEVADSHDDSLVEQPHFELVTAKKTKEPTPEADAADTTEGAI